MKHVEAVLTSEVVYFKALSDSPTILRVGAIVVVDQTDSTANAGGDWFDINPNEYVVFN